MAKEYTTSTNKYLDLNGLSYYDSKLKTWVGGQFTTKLADYYTKDAADAQFATLADFNAHVEAFTNWKTTNDADVKYSKDLWTAFLAGYDGTAGTAAPTLQEIKTFINSTAATKTDLNDAIAGLADVYLTQSDFATAKDEITNSISDVADDLADYKTSNDAAVKAVADDLAGYITSNDAAIAGLADVYLTQSDFATAKDEITNSISAVDGKVDGVANDLADYKTSNDAAVKKVADDLAGYITSNDAALAVVDGKADKNAQDIVTLKNGLSGAVHFIGVYDKLPDTANNGDIAIVGGAEYVYVVSGEGESVTAAWEKLGDTTTEMGAITDLTNALNDYKTSNDAALAVVDGKADKNAEDIATNANAISKNAEDIAKNAQDIAKNAEDIAKNAQDIAKNAEDIATNAGAITTLEAKVDKNAEDLTNALGDYIKAADFITTGEIDALFA